MQYLLYVSDHIKLVLEELEKHQGDFDGEHLKQLLKDVAELNKSSFSKLMMSMRTALSGLKVGPWKINIRDKSGSACEMLFNL